MLSYKLGTVFALLSVVFAPLAAASRIPLEARQVGSCFKCWKTMDTADLGSLQLADSEFTPTDGSTIDGEGTISCFYVLESDSSKQTFCSYDSLTGELSEDSDKVCYGIARFPRAPERCHDGRIPQTAEQA